MNFTPFPKLSTKRLQLRQITLSDAEEIFVFRSEERILKYIASPRLKTIEEAEKWISNSIESIAQNKFIIWGITLKEEDQLIGNICIWNIEETNFRGEIGYTLHPDFQGNGYMDEAVKEVLKYGFDELKLHSIEGHINPDNIGSIRLLERNGFIKEAHLKENQCHEGVFFDTAIYSLINPKD